MESLLRQTKPVRQSSAFTKNQGSLSRPQCPETGRLLREVLAFLSRFPGHAELRNSVISIISVIVAASNGNQGGLCSCSAGVQVSPLGQSVELELVRDVNTEIWGHILHCPPSRSWCDLVCLPILRCHLGNVSLKLWFPCLPTSHLEKELPHFVQHKPKQVLRKEKRLRPFCFAYNGIFFAIKTDFCRQNLGKFFITLDNLGNCYCAKPYGFD